MTSTQAIGRLIRGSSSLLISIPHSGINIPEELGARFSAQALELPDTDWFVDRLYAWAGDMQVSLLVAPWSRYVIDLNRPPDDKPLYDQKTSQILTGLVPLKTFEGKNVYKEGEEPASAEVQSRKKDYWMPYHEAISLELDRIRKCHGHAVLLDAHSIRQQQPLLFSGSLPDLNLGSHGGRSAAASLVESAKFALQHPDYSMILDGRFKGGYITRHYGQPKADIHALQLEMSQSVYMHEKPPKYRESRAQRIIPVLKNLVDSLMNWKPYAS